MTIEDGIRLQTQLRAVDVTNMTNEFLLKMYEDITLEVGKRYYCEGNTELVFSEEDREKALFIADELVTIC